MMRRKRTSKPALLVSAGFVALALGVFVFSGRGADVFGALFNRGSAIASFPSLLAAADALRGDPEGTAAALDRAERSALSVESFMSLLKRRRSLAEGNAAFRPSYRASLSRARELFPHSPELAVAALDSLLEDGAASVPADLVSAAGAGGYAEAGFAALALSGALQSIHSALGVDGIEDLLWAASAGAPAGNAAYRTNEVLLRAVRGDRLGALSAAAAGPLEEIPGRPPLRALLAYDYGDAAQAASLTAEREDAASKALAADALYASGSTAEARNLWRTLAGSLEYRDAALYNLAATAGTPEEKAEAMALLGGSLSGPGRGAVSPFSLILQSRELPDDEAYVFLDAALDSGSDPFLELERLRRGESRLGMDWAVGELWMILGRHPASVEVYEWGAYLLESYGRSDELTILRSAAELNSVASAALSVHWAVEALRRGDEQAAEAALSEVDAEAAPWQAGATLALIRELSRDLSGAVSFYQTAASLAADPKDRSRLHVRIARCFKAMGRTSDARRSLEYALDLDPSNLTAALELKKN